MVQLGTRDVEAYRLPPWCLNKVLYVEKKGLLPVLQAAQIAERYDMAIVAARAMPAARPRPCSPRLRAAARSRC